MTYFTTSSHFIRKSNPKPTITSGKQSVSVKFKPLSIGDMGSQNKKEIRMNLLSLLTLKPLTGTRSQITIVAGIIINAIFAILKALGIMSVDQATIDTINKGLELAFAYFMADKISNAVKK